MIAAARSRTYRVMLGAAVLLALAATVYAATRERAIRIAASPASQSVTAGGTARFSVELGRRGGFDRRVAINVRGLPARSRARWTLPGGATLARAYSRGPTVIIPARAKRVVLTVLVPAGTPAQRVRARIHAYGWGVRHTRQVRLEVRPGAVVRSAPAPGFALQAAQAGRAVLQGDEASWTIAIARSGGLTAPVAMDVAGLPPGAGARWSAADGLATGDGVTLTVATQRTTPVGSYEMTVSGNAAGDTESAVATIDVLETKPFGVSGDATAPLRPGSASPIDVRLSNPYDFPLRVERLEVAAATSAPGCSSANYAVDQFAGSYPVVIPPGDSRLADLVPAGALPRVRMNETGTDQDACKGAAVQLTYAGVAGK